MQQFVRGELDFHISFGVVLTKSNVSFSTEFKPILSQFRGILKPKNPPYYNLVNQAFLTAINPIVAKDILWRLHFFPVIFFSKLECKNENRSSTVRRDKLCLLARFLWELVALLPSIQTKDYLTSVWPFLTIIWLFDQHSTRVGEK